MFGVANLMALVLLSTSFGVAAHGQKAAKPRFEPIRVVSATGAVYPVDSLGNGTLVLRVTVDGDGKIEKIGVIYGIQSLTQGAERAVREWKFEPATLDGTPVTTSMIAAFTYGAWPFANAFGKIGPREENQPASFFTPIQIVAQAAPVYPFASVAAGTVVLQAAVDESGEIQSITALHNIPSLTESAERAIRRWRFKPALLDARPVTTLMVASFAFRLPSSWRK